MSRPITLQRIESAVLLAIVLYAYYLMNGSWLWFALLILSFDISMIGYLKGNSLGRITYNLGHTYVFPGLLVLVAYVNDIRWLMLFALIWLAHISLDRTFGYGLKLQDFHHTHLGPISKQKKKTDSTSDL